MPKRILLADDSITIQKVVELTFSDGDYEVTAVNNGAKAIQKLAEMRPDIILSDIIMPEKNGYEVCEFVKSHPEYRTIPVVLLTGTFEPFDPDRADKAGCDAVVTKPFESQSLIAKVEELISQSVSAAPTAPQQALPETPPLSTGVFTPAASEPFQEHGSEIFQAPQAESTQPAAEMPFAAGAPEFIGETRAFPRMSFEEMQKMANEAPAAPPPPPAAAPAPPEPSPWDEQPAAATAPEPSPWDEQPSTGGETRAFASMSFEEMRRMASEPPAAAPAPPPAPAPEASPWDEEPPSGGGETHAFAEAPAAEPPPAAAPEVSLWDSPPQESAAPEPPPAPPAPEPSPWDEQPSTEFAGETRAFPGMSFDDLEKMAASTPAPEPPAETPFEHEMSTAAPMPASEPEPADEAAPATAAGDLSEEQIDRIARRVVQLMSDQVVRNIAWEVIPDLAEMVVKERIRQLEAE